MQDVKTGQARAGHRRRGTLRFDGLLLATLVVGWLLIFASATLALRRHPQRWLPVELFSQVSADYGVDAPEAPRLAPVRHEIVAAVKQDALVATPSVVPEGIAEATPGELPTLVLGPTPTPTLKPTLSFTATLSPGPAGLSADAGGPYVGEEGSPIALAARGASLSPGALSYDWDLDNDGVYDDGNGVWATVVFYDEGEYTVGVQASDAAGRVASASSTVSVRNVAPSIYGLRDRNASEGQEVSFSAGVEDPGHDVLLYSWDFGDGARETGTLRPRHTYLDEGAYVVRLRAEDNDGGVSEAVIFAYVGNLAPRVDAGGDRVTDEGSTVTLSGSATDAGAFDRLSYAWDLDYDGESFRADVEGATATAVYPDGPAEVVAALRVRDDDGGQGIDTVKVRVNNVAPRILSVRHASPVGEGTPLTLEVEATDVGDDELSYAFDWENDGALDAVGQPARVSHAWPDEGEYTVRVVAEDGDGGQVYSTTTVVAYNVAPVAVAEGPQVGYEGSMVTFDGSGTSDAGMYDVLSYEWDFGDGSPVAGEAVVGHVYADNRVYSATLRVWDDSGATSVDELAVAVLNANPVVELGPERAVNEGETLSLTGTASDPGAGDVLSLAWDLDYDGVIFDEDVTGTAAVDWSYGDGPASYVVAFRVRDDDYPYPTEGGGGVGETIDTLGVVVNNVAPLANAGGKYEGEEKELIELVGTAVDVAADALRYEWDVDGDGAYESVGERVPVRWDRAGEYEVALRVTDGDGGEGLDTAKVQIGNGLPVAEAGGPYSGDEGRPIGLIGSGSDPTGDPLTYRWDLDYDGNFETAGAVVTHTWEDNGEYTVALRVADGRGGVATDKALVSVKNVPPSVSIGGPYATTVGITLTLVATATDVSSDTLIYTWDLDYDGAFDDGAGEEVTYVWTATGVYTVALQVDDGDGGVVTDTTTVNVNTLVPIAWLGVSYLLLRRKRPVFFVEKEENSHIHSSEHHR